jgi:FkbM family methyltransferase
VVRNGLSFELDISDYMEWLIYFGIEVEPREPLLRLARSGDVVIDVGANVGEVALLLAHRVGASGRVLAFEPHPAIHERARRNLELNRLGQLELVRRGLGAEPGHATLAIPVSSNRGGTRISAAGEGLEIEITTIDRFVAERALPRVDLIKIDVEGFEHHVLRGGRATLERHHPRLFVEVDDDNLRAQGTSARELVGLVEELGYRITHAQLGVPVGRDHPFAGAHFDIIAQAGD